MSIVLLLLFALSVVYTGLRATWERGPGHDFLKAKPNDREQLVPGVLGMFLLVAWFWEVPSSSGWWYLLLALLALWLALSMLYALGAALIHPEQLRLSSRHARSPAAAFPAGKESKPRGPSILAFLAGAALFLVVFAELLPDEAIELRHNVAIGLLLVMAASGVMLGWVLFRPWSIIRQHPNQEDAQAFCLLVMMLFFHAALLATPAEHEERMAVFGFGTVLLIMASLLAFGRRKTGAGHSRVQAGSSALCALCMPVSLMCGVMLVPEVHVQEPSLTAVQRAAIAHQEARSSRTTACVTDWCAAIACTGSCEWAGTGAGARHGGVRTSGCHYRDGCPGSRAGPESGDETGHRDSSEAGYQGRDEIRGKASDGVWGETGLEGGHETRDEARDRAGRQTRHQARNGIGHEATNGAA